MLSCERTNLGHISSCTCTCVCIINVHIVSEYTYAYNVNIHIWIRFIVICLYLSIYMYSFSCIYLLVCVFGYHTRAHACIQTNHRAQKCVNTENLFQEMASFSKYEKTGFFEQIDCFFRVRNIHFSFRIKKINGTLE